MAESTTDGQSDSVQHVLTLLEEMIVQQREKCLKLARRIIPHLTADDLMNPFDWPEVATNPQVVWEDGLLAGLQTAHAAISSQRNEGVIR